MNSETYLICEIIELLSAALKVDAHTNSSKIIVSDNQSSCPILGQIEFLRSDKVDLVRAEDQRRDAGDLSQQRDAVVEGRLPILSLIEALLIRLSELGLCIKGRDGDR